MLQQRIVTHLAAFERSATISTAKLQGQKNNSVRFWKSSTRHGI
jgi:hypothetical protein